MAITSAQVEANGWVLRVTHSSGLGSFASYALDPEGTPRLTLAGSHPGFDVAGGVAVANPAKPRGWVATKPVRKPAVVSNAGVLDAAVIDETDLGGGSVRVRLALSKRVYATDANLTLAALAGWRAGEAAASGIAVTNGSTQVAPVPIHRWADVPYQLRRGAFDLELLVFGFAPAGTQPVAGVKFTVTDGTTVKTYWSTALSTSTQYGDALRCHRVTVDATGLTAGLLRCDAEVYPWVGAVRTTDPAGMRSMSGLTIAAFSAKAQAPFTVAWDPAATRYTRAAVYVDYVNGTATPSAAMVGTGATDASALAAAKAVAPAARAKDIATAVEAIFKANRSYGAGNGQPSTGGGFWIIDGAQIVLAPHVHAGGYGAAGGTFGTSSNETWAQIVGDPTDPNPRANCILRTSLANQTNDNRLSRAQFKDLTIEAGYYLSRFINYWWLDNVEVRGAAGKETDGTVLTVPDPGTGNLGLHFTRTRIWKSGLSFDASFGNGGMRTKLIRKCEWRRKAEAPVVVTGRLIPEVEDNSFTGLTGSTYIGPLNNYAGSAQAFGVYDSILAYNDLRACRERLFGFASVSAADAGTTIDQLRRLVVFGNVGERIGTASSDAFLSIGELNNPAAIDEIVFENNTLAGARCNFFYNDPAVAGSVAATDAPAWQHTLGEVRVANNAFDWHPTKHDRFNDPAVQAQRTAAADPRAHGYRPQLTACLAEVYGVGHEGNVDLWRDPLRSGDFFREYEGLRGRFDNAFIDAKYASDLSLSGGDGIAHPTNLGLGNYQPLAGSPLAARATSANSDRDLTSAARGGIFAAGAIEPAAGATALLPAGARSMVAGSATLVGWAGGLAPVRSVSATRAAATIVQWRGALAPAASRLPTRATSASLATGSVAPATRLAPAGATLALRDGFSLVLQPGGNTGPGTVRTIMIPDDFRVHTITLS